MSHTLCLTGSSLPCILKVRSYESTLWRCVILLACTKNFPKTWLPNQRHHKIPIHSKKVTREIPAFITSHPGNSSALLAQEAQGKGSNPQNQLFE